MRPATLPATTEVPPAPPAVEAAPGEKVEIFSREEGLRLALHRLLDAAFGAWRSGRDIVAVVKAIRSGR